MRKKRYYPLGYHSDIKIGFGTTDVTNTKSVYISFKSWVNLKEEDGNINRKIGALKKEIKKYIYNLKYPFIKDECIVDIDVSLTKLNVDKKCFIDIEITLFTEGKITLKEEQGIFSTITKDIIDKCFEYKSPFNFYKTKT